MSPRPAVLMATLLVAMAGPAAFKLQAAEAIETPSADDGFIEVGPFYFRPRLTFKDLGYDSNVFLTRDNEDGDFTATLGPSLEAATLFGHRGRLDLSQEVDLVGFLNTPSQNHVNSRSQAAWQIGFSDFTYRGRAGYANEKLRPSEEIDERERQRNEFLSGELSWSRSSRATLALLAGRNRYRFSGNPLLFGNNLSDLDRDETSTGLKARVRILPKTDAVMELRHTSIDHTRPELGRDAVMRRLIPGLVFDDSALIQGEIHLGVLRFDPDRAGRRSYSGPVGRAVLSTRLGRRLRLQPSYQRDLVFSIFANNLFYRTETFGLSAFTSLSSRFRLETGGSRSALHYPDLVSFPAFTGLRRDRITRYWLGWSYALDSRPRYGFRVEWRDRNSNFDLEDDTQVRVIGRASYSF
ncbi:MAG: outer membrane beta-barrel protein [Acidobacteriota bacterium]